jgi:hypothetical protein
VSNETDHPLFMYALAIDQDGRIAPYSAWNPGPIQVHGLGPGATQDTAVFHEHRELEMQEFHFIVSPHVIWELLSPVSNATRVSTIGADLTGVTQHVERYTTMDLTAQERTTKR